MRAEINAKIFRRLGQTDIFRTKIFLAKEEPEIFSLSDEHMIASKGSRTLQAFAPRRVCGCIVQPLETTIRLSLDSVYSTVLIQEVLHVPDLPRLPFLTKCHYSR